MAANRRKKELYEELDQIVMSGSATNKASSNRAWKLARKLKAVDDIEQSTNSEIASCHSQFRSLASLQPFIQDEQVRSIVARLTGGEEAARFPEVCHAAKEVLRPPLTEGLQTPDTHLVDWFTGTINRLDKATGVAVTTLYDEDNKEYVAHLDLLAVTKAGLQKGDHFLCLLSGEGDSTEMDLVKRTRPMSDSQRATIRRLVARAVELLTAPEDTNAQEHTPSTDIPP